MTVISTAFFNKTYARILYGNTYKLHVISNDTGTSFLCPNKKTKKWLILIIMHWPTYRRYTYTLNLKQKKVSIDMYINCHVLPSLSINVNRRRWSSMFLALSLTITTMTNWGSTTVLSVVLITKPRPALSATVTKVFKLSTKSTMMKLGPNNRS